MLLTKGLRSFVIDNGVIYHVLLTMVSNVDTVMTMVATVAIVMTMGATIATVVLRLEAMCY